MTDIRVDILGARADLVLNRPHKKNALNLAMWAAIPGLLAPLAADAAVRVLVVRGEGAAFAAGADIAEFATAYATPAAARANQDTMIAAMAALESFPKPTVAQISGPCVGGGCALALCCDIRVAASDARFGITPAKLGLAYGIADTRRLIAAVGASRAKDILFTGRLLDAAEALRIGLIDRLAADAVTETAALVADLVCGSGYTARAVKAVCAMLRSGAVADTDESATLFAEAFEGADFREGYEAFMAKRAPVFP